MLAAKHDYWSQSLEPTWWKERPDFEKFSSDLHMYIMAQECMHVDSHFFFLSLKYTYNILKFHS